MSKAVLVLDYNRDEEGNFILSREQLDQLIDDVYEMGVKDGRQPVPVQIPSFRGNDWSVEVQPLQKR